MQKQSASGKKWWQESSKILKIKLDGHSNEQLQQRIAPLMQRLLRNGRSNELQMQKVALHKQKYKRGMHKMPPLVLALLHVGHSLRCGIKIRLSCIDALKKKQVYCEVSKNHLQIIALCKS